MTLLTNYLLVSSSVDECCLFITCGLRRIAALGPSEAKALHESCSEKTFGDCSGVYIRSKSDAKCHRKTATYAG